MINEDEIDVKKYINDRKRPGPRDNSVHYENDVDYDKKERFSIAKNQLSEQFFSKEEIIKLTNEFIKACNIPVLDDIEKNQVFIKDISSIKEFNKKTKENYGLTNEKDIIWMKFANTGHLGVVACSNDVNFDIPSPDSSSKCYAERVGSKWKYNTSGIILHYLGCHWDETSFLVFPLKELEAGKGGTKRRHQIETGVGNYLLHKKVPILDYYSHRI